MKKTRRMPKASQVAFAKAWLERQNIEAQTIDVASLIDGSLSYEENIKNLKKHLKMGGRSRKKATRTMTASECDVEIGNYEAGFDHQSTKKACECGDPAACDDARREKKPKSKPKKKPKAKKAKKTVKAKPKTKKRSAQHTLGGKKKPQKKPKKPKKVKKCKTVHVKPYTRKCPAKKRR